MKSLKNLQANSIFRVPELTTEQWEAQNARVREWEAEQERIRMAQRLSAAGIPEGYRDAAIGYPKIAEWVENPSVGLLLQGKVGRGKTYQACAALLAHMKGENDPQKRPRSRTARFTTFDDLLRECRATFNNWETEEDVIARYANTGMLCIDDMGKERATEWSLPIIFSIINKRSMSLKPTIITTQYNGQQLIERMTVNGDSETARAIISRMVAYDRMEIVGEDRRRGNHNG